MPEHSLTLLHVSDLHQRTLEVSSWRRVRVLGEAWERNLDTLLEEDPVDLVCFTGDAAFSGRADEYCRATEFFQAMLERLELGWERFFSVLGNHDINRRVSRPAWKRLRLQLPQAKRSEVAEWLAGGRTPLGFNARDRKEILKRQSAYRQWIKRDLGRLALDPEGSSHGLLGYRQTLSLPGMPFALHIVGLDSAWMCGDEDDAGHLWLTDEQVMRLSTEEGKKLDGFRLAMIHHPLEDLADSSEARRLLAERVDLVLRGHLHEPAAQVWADSERTLRQMVAGCLYEHDRYPNACQRIRVVLDQDGRPLRYELRFRGWSEHGHWFDDNSLYSNTVDGRWTLWAEGGGPAPEVDSSAAQLFVGREAELAQLAQSVLGKGAVKPAKICAVQGMPGVGKSYLVERFAHLHQDQFPGGVWALRLDTAGDAGETSDLLLAKLGDRLHLSLAPMGLDERIRSRLLLPRSLLVIENVDSELLARASAVLVGWLRGCPVVMTGRFQGLGETLGWTQLRVRPFDEATALAQLQEELGEDAPREEADAYRRLVREVGFLPLAVHLAAGYLKLGHSVDGFMRKLRHTGWALPVAEVGERVLIGEESRRVIAMTFQLSLDLLKAELGAEGEKGIAGLIALGQAPASGFGPSLGAAIAGLETFELEALEVAAGRLSLLEAIPVVERGDRAWRIHPLLAELLRAQGGKRASKAALRRMTDWFCSRLPGLPYGREEEQGRRWREIQAETLALASWLAQIGPNDWVQVERAGSWYAMSNGPFHAWLHFLESLLDKPLGEKERSDALLSLGHLARRVGDLNRAASAAGKKAELDRLRGDDRDKALTSNLLADVLRARGEFKEALRIRLEEELPVYQRLGDVREQAVAMGKIADVLQARGEFEEALRIRRGEELPIYERLGDLRSRAVTMGKIANVLQARRQFEEVLRIRREEELPVYERLGDTRSVAVTMGKIAGVLNERGEFEESLRIRREEQLPIFERLGDTRSIAVTKGKIADVLQECGEFEESLRIRREEQLPIFEWLGDDWSRAETMGKIADVLQPRGDLEESLRIRREEQLPVYERLGDVRSWAVTMGKIADALQARGKIDEVLYIRREKQLPVYERLGDVRSKAIIMGKIAEVLQAKGEFEQALRIRQKEQLPVFERLCDADWLAATRVSIANLVEALKGSSYAPCPARHMCRESAVSDSCTRVAGHDGPHFCGACQMPF